ncbi:MAG TPA: mechanosensitive ion channel domain-containing protein [Sphingobium sp.]
MPALHIMSVAMRVATAGTRPEAVDVAEPSLLQALTRDAGSAIDLLDRQLQIPFRFSGGFIFLIAMLALAVVIIWPLRLLLLSKLNALINRGRNNSPLAIYGGAVGAVVATVVLVTLSAWLALFSLGAALPLLPEVRHLAQTVAFGMVIAGFGLGIGRALHSPEDKVRRPIQLPPGLGRVVAFYPFAAGLMLALSSFVDQSSRALHATATSWTIAQSVIVILQAVLIGRFLILAGQARERQVETAASAGKEAGIPAVFGLTTVAWLVLFVGCSAFLMGRTRFGALLVQELLWAGLLLTLAWLLTRFLDALVMRLLDTDRRAGRFATGIVGVGQARVAQTAMLGSIVLTVLVWIVALALIAAPLQGDGATVADQMRPTPLMSALGSLNMSPRTILTAIAVLVAGIALTRLFRQWLEDRFLPSTSLDLGARSSITTTLGYVGVILAMLTATTVLGVQLEKITLIASALSVGIGFGLQSIIQNFVSGLILLIERPVTLGDWVSVSGAEGTIRKIRVRATEIATSDGSISIVPNSAFISTTVTNRTVRPTPGHIDLQFVVAGEISADAAMVALEAMIGGCDAIRHDPAPAIYVHGLGEDSYTFDVQVYPVAGRASQEARSGLLLSVSRQSRAQNLKISLA